MPSKSRKAAIRQSNTRKRKKVTKPNIKNFDLEKPQDINEITEINKDNSDYNNIAQHTRDISKKIVSNEATVNIDNNLFFELKRILLVSGIIAILLGILTVSIP
ncbi:MAG: hypothetical protein CL766_01520 [Chloroflexi bacterium]|jgi:uncharacterized membrane protein|nr:hypothetical protein [Chloroflexota bacterium]MCH2305104.1 hypothetical protein [SAR202 cluster bacterium]|tara:strand:+ start:326 stop:637 length:312 start_codon:yes stop_codon:yes gene_type:complete